MLQRARMKKDTCHALHCYATHNKTNTKPRTFFLGFNCSFQTRCSSEYSSSSVFSFSDSRSTSRRRFSFCSCVISFRLASERASSSLSCDSCFSCIFSFSCFWRFVSVIVNCVRPKQGTAITRGRKDATSACIWSCFFRLCPVFFSYPTFAECHDRLDSAPKRSRRPVNRGLFFSVRNRNVFGMTGKNCHFGQNVWKQRLKTLLRRVSIQLWDNWPKCFSDQNISAKNDRNVSAKKKRTGEPLLRCKASQINQR